MHAAVYFEFDFRNQSNLRDFKTGIINSVNIPSVRTEKYDSQRGKDHFQMMEEGSFTGFGIYICPNLVGREFYPEVISHIGPSKIVIFIGGKPVWDFPPGMLSMQPAGRLIPAKPARLVTQMHLRIEWQIIDNDIPPPVLFTVGFEGVMTKDVM